MAGHWPKVIAIKSSNLLVHLQLHSVSSEKNRKNLKKNEKLPGQLVPSIIIIQMVQFENWAKWKITNGTRTMQLARLPQRTPEFHPTRRIE